MYNQRSGQIWIIGGANYSLPLMTCTNSVWTSTNMREWQQINATAYIGPSRCMATSAIDTKGALYLGPGTRTELWSSYENNFYKSTDAANWTLACTQAPFEHRLFARMSIVRSGVLGRDIITYVGGATRNYNRLSDVWMSSDDAASWSLVTAAAAFPGRDSFFMVVSRSNMLIVATGISNGAATPLLKNDIWISLDGGMDWYQCSAQMPMSGRYSASAFFDADDHLFILGGNAGSMTSPFVSDVWRSAFSFNDSLLLARACIGRSAAVIPINPGLQCWPPNSSTCGEVDGLVVAHISAQFDSVETTAMIHLSFVRITFQLMKHRRYGPF